MKLGSSLVFYMALCYPSQVISQTAIIFFPHPFLYINQGSPYSFIYQKKVPLGVDHYWEYSPPNTPKCSIDNRLLVGFY